MKHFIIRTIIPLIVLSGIMFTASACSAAPGRWANNKTDQNSQEEQETQQDKKDRENPNRWPFVSLTEMRTGFTRVEIRSMPLVERPNRPGHFIGNTIRRRVNAETAE